MADLSRWRRRGRYPLPGRRSRGGSGPPLAGGRSIRSPGVIRSIAQALPELLLAGAFLYAWRGASGDLPGAGGLADAFRWWLPGEAFAVAISSLLIWFGTRAGRRFRGGAFAILVLLVLILLPTTPLLAVLTGSAWPMVTTFVLLLFKFCHFTKSPDRTVAAIATAWTTGYAALIAATAGVLALVGRPIAEDALLVGAVYFAGLGLTEGVVHAVVRAPPVPPPAAIDLVPMPALRWRALGYAWAPALAAGLFVCLHLGIVGGPLLAHLLHWSLCEFMATLTCAAVVWSIAHEDEKEPWAPWVVGAFFLAVGAGAHVLWAWDLEIPLASVVGMLVLFGLKVVGVWGSPRHAEFTPAAQAGCLAAASPLLIGLVWIGYWFVGVIVGPHGLDVAGPAELPFILAITFYGLLAVTAFLVGCGALNHVPVEDGQCLGCRAPLGDGAENVFCGVCISAMARDYSPAASEPELETMLRAIRDVALREPGAAGQPREQTGFLEPTDPARPGPPR